MDNVFVSSTGARLGLASETDVLAAIESRVLDESHYLDLKREAKPALRKRGCSGWLIGVPGAGAGGCRGLLMMEVLDAAHREDLDVPDSTFAVPDVTSFARLDGLGLQVVGQFGV